MRVPTSDQACAVTTCITAGKTQRPTNVRCQDAFTPASYPRGPENKLPRQTSRAFPEFLHVLGLYLILCQDRFLPHPFRTTFL